MGVAENIVARESFTRWLKPRVAPLTAVEAEKALFGWIYKRHSRLPTFDDCKTVLNRLYRDRGMDDATTLLQRFGSKGITELPDCLYQRFFERAWISVYYGVSPAFGWVSEDEVRSLKVPRDRYLMLNRQTGTLVEHRGALNVDEAVWKDVSAVDEYEQRFSKERAS